MKRTLWLSACGMALLAGPAFAQDVDLEAGDSADVTTPITPTTDEKYGFTWGDSDYGFFSHGYLRAGVGNSDDDTFYTFKLDGAQSKYRLGNESDLYGELGVGWRAALGNGSDLVLEFMANGYGDSNAFNNGAEFAGDTGVVQAYAGIERIGDGALADGFVWAGRRFYRRRDVHMTDFYYENMSGDGIGLENMQFGTVGVSAAAFYHKNDDIDFQSYALDVRVHDIDMGMFVGEVGAIWIDGRGDDQSGDDGYSLRFHLESDDLTWGQFRSGFMYGAGAGIDFNSTGSAIATSDDWRSRVVAQALIVSSDKLESQATAVWERTSLGEDKQDWYSIGIRPQYNFTKNWGAALELGYDRVESDSLGNNDLGKITLAPFYSFGRTGYFARPQLRAFATWASWNDPGAITEQASFGTATDGMTYGVQLEHWW